jgi:glucose-1-phosphate thymidylyltransferase
MELLGVLAFDDAGPAGATGLAAYVGASEHIANRPIAHHVLDDLESSGVGEVVVVSSVERSKEVRACISGRDPGDGALLRYVERRAPLDLDQPLAPFIDLVDCDSPDVVLILHQCRNSAERLSPATQAMLQIHQLETDGTAVGLAGVWLFGPGALQLVSGAIRRTGGELDLTMVAERIRGAGGSLDVRVVDAWRRYAGDPLDLLELNRMALDRLESPPRRVIINGNRIEGRVWIHEDASVERSVIIGPVVIGAGAQISDAYIGPYTSVGPHAVIEGAEIEMSIVSARASIMHVGSRLVSSVVGRDARIFRDFTLPKAFRLRIGEGTEIALC